MRIFMMCLAGFLAFALPCDAQSAPPAATGESQGTGPKAPPPAGLDQSRILPLIKDREWVADVTRTAVSRGAPFAPLYDDFNAELVIVYAEDQPQRTRFLDEKEVKMDKASLRKLAIANLRKSLPKIEMRDLGPVAFLSAGGDYDASLLLLDDIWSDGQIKRKGETLVAIPGHDTLLISGTGEPEGLAPFRTLVNSMKSSARKPLTNAVFVYRGGKFIKFEGT